MRRVDRRLPSDDKLRAKTAVPYLGINEVPGSYQVRAGGLAGSAESISVSTYDMAPTHDGALTLGCPMPRAYASGA